MIYYVLVTVFFGINGDVLVREDILNTVEDCRHLQEQREFTEYTPEGYLGNISFCQKQIEV